MKQLLLENLGALQPIRIAPHDGHNCDEVSHDNQGVRGCPVQNHSCSIDHPLPQVIPDFPQSDRHFISVQRSSDPAVQLSLSNSTFPPPSTQFHPPPTLQLIQAAVSTT